MNKPDNKSLHIKKGTDVTDSVNPKYRAKKLILRSADEYVDGILTGNRTLLSQAITLVESTREEYNSIGREVLEKCLPHTGNSVRVGITGVPGAGKSTFIEAMGRYLIDKKGKKLAVLTIDPSSSRSKGSILGDKTRMPLLSSSENAFIRPSPTSGSLGGVARQTREAMLLCEAAGFDTVFIETVGVGQSETAVHFMVDFFLLILIAGAGDELQGIKRGVMEMADLIAINKAEGDNRQAAKQAKKEYENALSLFPVPPSGRKTKVVTCSALLEKGMEAIWIEIEDYFTEARKNDYFSSRRSEQAVHWMYETIHQQIKDRFYNDPAVKTSILKIETQVLNGEISSTKAAEELLRRGNV